MQNEWQYLYSRLALRRVRFERTARKMRNFEAWVNTVLGQPYSLTVRKLRKKRQEAVNADGTMAEGMERRAEEGFFCSELVAEAMMALQIIPAEKAASRYWPGDFGAHMPPLALNPGCSIGDELLIDFRVFEKKPWEKITQWEM